MLDEKDWEKIHEKANNRKTIIKELFKNADPKMFEGLKKFVEESFYSGQELSFQVVLDTSMLIRHLRVYLKYKHSYLFDLLESPFIKIIAPHKLNDEIFDKLDGIAEDFGLSVNEVKEIVNKILTKITIIDLQRDRSYLKAVTLIEERDKNDVEFVAVYFRSSCKAILTADKDILEIDSITSWKSTKESCEIVNLFQQGTVSSVIFIGGGSVLAIGFFFLSLLFLSVLESLVLELIKKIVKIIKDGFVFLSSLPTEWKIILGLATVSLLMWDESRDVIFTIIKDKIQNIKTNIKQFIDFFKPYIMISGKWITIEILSTSKALLENIEEMQSHMDVLNIQLENETIKYIDENVSK